MSCQAFQEHLLSGEPLPEALASHGTHCAECQDVQRLWGTLQALPQPEPSADLALRFHQRLATVLAQGKVRSLRPDRGSWWLPAATAAALLLSVGVGLGYVLRGSDPRLDSAQARLQWGSAGERLEAIAQVNNRSVGQGDILSALLDRVQRDPSLQVRLSAVEALYLFGADPELSHRIEAALPTQVRPEVQLALIDLLAALRQQRAAEALRRLVREERLSPAVRQRAEQRLGQLSL